MYQVNYIQHHGILGQKWGVRRYQNPDGTWTEAGKRRRNNGGSTTNVVIGKKHDVKEKIKATAKVIGSLALAAGSAYVTRTVVPRVLSSIGQQALNQVAPQIANNILTPLNPAYNNKIPYSYGPRPFAPPKDRTPYFAIALADLLGFPISPNTPPDMIHEIFTRPHTASLSNVKIDRINR